MGFWSLITKAERIAMLIVILGKASYAVEPVVRKAKSKYRERSHGKITIRERFRGFRSRR